MPTSPGTRPEAKWPTLSLSSSTVPALATGQLASNGTYPGVTAPQSSLASTLPSTQPAGETLSAAQRIAALTAALRAGSGGNASTTAAGGRGVSSTPLVAATPSTTSPLPAQFQIGRGGVAAEETRAGTAFAPAVDESRSDFAPADRRQQSPVKATKVGIPVIPGASGLWGQLDASWREAVDALRAQREEDQKRASALSALDREGEELAREAMQLRSRVEQVQMGMSERARLAVEVSELRQELADQESQKAAVDTDVSSSTRHAAAEAQLALLDQLDQARTELRESVHGRREIEAAPNAMIDRLTAQLASARESEVATFTELATARRMEAGLRAEVEASRQELEGWSLANGGSSVADLQVHLAALTREEALCREEASAVQGENALLRSETASAGNLSNAVNILEAQLATAREGEQRLRNSLEESSRSEAAACAESVRVHAEIKAARSEEALTVDLQARLALTEAQNKQLMDEIIVATATKSQLRSEVSETQQSNATEPAWRVELNDAHDKPASSELQQFQPAVGDRLIATEGSTGPGFGFMDRLEATVPLGPAPASAALPQSAAAAASSGAALARQGFSPFRGTPGGGTGGSTLVPQGLPGGTVPRTPTQPQSRVQQPRQSYSRFGASASPTASTGAPCVGGPKALNAFGPSASSAASRGIAPSSGAGPTSRSSAQSLGQAGTRPRPGLYSRPPPGSSVS